MVLESECAPLTLKSRACLERIQELEDMLAKERSQDSWIYRNSGCSCPEGIVRGHARSCGFYMMPSGT